MAYKIRCNLHGHEKDVRAVCSAVYPDGAIISGSRDVTTKLWTPNESDLGFTEAHVMSGHSNFVSSVCVMPPDEKYPQGLILTGSNDKTILAYTLESPQAIYKLEGHEDNVCALAAGRFGSLISGSWDKTAKVWLNQKNVMTLKGHEAAVWAVAIMPEGGFMLTGSADKSVKMWRAGKCERTFIGHRDCVRGLAVLSATEFLSCSNDASIKRWLTAGDCTNTYYGHTNFVYDIAVLANGTDFATCSEDRALKVWKDGECVQTIVHPTTSVWTVCVLSNGDIVTGGSDGVVRIFTMAPERAAEEELQKAFEDEVASSIIPAQIGDIKTDQLAGPEALFNPGTRDGQTLMVKDGNKVEAHQWNASEGRWVKIGDVVGGSGGTQASSGKTLYEGKEYDYVFDVELTEGKPALKLPYNASEDPWMAAHNWLQKNELSAGFLDQVANFIMEQTKGVTLGPAAPSGSDPFTGAGRYVPGSGGAPVGGVGDTDPLTGGGRYVPSYGNQNGTQAGVDPLTGSGAYTSGTLSGDGGMKSVINTYFPKQSYISFESANAQAILGKLKELNTKVDSSMQISDDQITAMEGLINGKGITATLIHTLWNLVKWPKEHVFPALDVLRLSIRFLEVNELFFSNIKYGVEFLEIMLKFITHDSIASNQMLAIRTLCNSFLQSPGETVLVANRDMIMTSLLECKSSTNKNVHIAVSSLLLNYAVALYKNRDVEAKAQCLSIVGEFCQNISDNEAKFRLLVCIGTLLQNDMNCIKLAEDMGFAVFINKCLVIADPIKVHECAKFVGDLMKIT